MLHLVNISKTYDNGVKALDDVNLTIGRGMFGLLGPNGAGKSSLMRTIATLQLPDNGKILFDGEDTLANPQGLRQHLGYLPQEFGVYQRVNAFDMLNHMALLKGIIEPEARREQVTALLQQTNLYQHRKKAVATFSGGMKQRFGIAQALLGTPKLIIVDEPTAGLDPEERNRFHNLLSEIGENTVVILSTHIVDDVRTLCQDMAVLNKGQIVEQGSPDELIDKIADQVWKKVVNKSQLKDYQNQFNILSQRLCAGTIELHVLSPDKPEQGFVKTHADLEHVYFSAVEQ